MFDGPGISVDDVAVIEREQFVYFMEMERETGDVSDWSAFRAGLGDAIATALGWEPADAQRGAEVIALLDAACEVADPSTDWPRFSDEVWAQLLRRRRNAALVR